MISFGGDDLIVFGGDDLINFGGDDLISFGGDDLIVLAGDVQPEPTYAGGKGLGRTTPYGVKACIVGTPGCTFRSALHRGSTTGPKCAGMHPPWWGTLTTTRCNESEPMPDSAYANVVGTDSVKVNHIIDTRRAPEAELHVSRQGAFR